MGVGSWDNLSSDPEDKKWEQKLVFQAFSLFPKWPRSYFGSGQLQLSDVCFRQGVLNKGWEPSPEAWKLLRINHLLQRAP